MHPLTAYVLDLADRTARLSEDMLEMTPPTSGTMDELTVLWTRIETFIRSLFEFSDLGTLEDVVLECHSVLHDFATRVARNDQQLTDWLIILARYAPR